MDAVISCTGSFPFNPCVMAAAAELPRGIRINAVSPTVLAEASGYHEFFPGFSPVPADEVGRANVKSLEGIQTRQVFALD